MADARSRKGQGQVRAEGLQLRKVLFAVALVLGVCIATSATLGCATAYAPVHDLVGDGYRESRLDSNTWRVAFAGNGATSRDTVEKYLLYRCAEITSGASFDYFIVVDTNTSVRTSHAPDIYQSMTMYDGAGNATTTGQYVPGASSRSHVARATIRAFNGAKPSGDPGAFDAAEVLTYLGPQIRGASSPAVEASPASGAKPGAERRVAVGEPKAPDRQVGKWATDQEAEATLTSLISEKKEATFPDTNFRGILVVACLHKNQAVWIEMPGDSWLRFGRPGAVVHFDGEAATWAEMTLYSSGTQMEFADPRKEIALFSEHDRMFVEVSLRLHDVQTVLQVLEFHLLGFSEAVKPVLAACR